jgi:hypothetical protein
VIGSAAADSTWFQTSSVQFNGFSMVPTNNEKYTYDGIGVVLTFDTVTVGAGTTVTFPAIQRLNALTVNGTAISAPGAVLGLGIVARSFSMGPNGKMDLNDNDMIIDYSASSSSPLSTIQSLINSARAGGSWSGATGLTSSSARTSASHNTTLGAMENSDYRALWGDLARFDNQPLDATAVLIKYTYYGDANFSGTVNFDDYVRLDTGFNTHRTGWSNGDFNGSGSVDFDDYVLIDISYNTQGSPL